jgi:hypothetical protein
MDAIFHITQGQKLLTKNDKVSIVKAVEHFRTANELTPETDVGKPQSLYFLALGNYYLGNLEAAYIIVNKAKEIIPIVKKASIINLPVWPGEEKINELLNFLKTKYTILSTVDLNSPNFDFNFIDKSRVDLIYPDKNPTDVQIQLIEMSDLDNEIRLAVFGGMGRNDEDMVYFDKVGGDVLSYVQGYFSSHLGDQTETLRALSDKIMSNSPKDYVDDERYVLIPRLVLTDFIDEFKSNANQEILHEFINNFSEVAIKKFETYGEITSTDDLAFSEHFREEFFQLFNDTYREKVPQYEEDLMICYEKTGINLSSKWLSTVIH